MQILEKLERFARTITLYVSLAGALGIGGFFTYITDHNAHSKRRLETVTKLRDDFGSKDPTVRIASVRALAGANLKKADLSGANLRGANLDKVTEFREIKNLTKAGLAGAEGLSREDLEYAKSKGAIVTE